MTKKALYSVFLLLCCIYLPCAQAEEKITLSTFYPAPYGEYDELAANSMVVGRTYPYPADDNLIVEGSVGIGTESPDGVLDVTSSGTPQVYIQSSAGSGDDAILHIRGARTTSTSSDLARIVFEDNAYDGPLAQITARKETSSTTEGNLLFYTSPSGSTLTEGMRIDKDGNLGIGTSDPNGRLDIKSSGGGYYGLHLQNAAGTRIAAIWEDGGNNGKFELNDNTGSRKILLESEANRSSYIANGGNVGIGTTGPGNKLTIKGDADSYPFSMRDSSDDQVISFFNDETGPGANSGAIFFYDTTGGTHTAIEGRPGKNSYFDNGGNVGIGTTSPGNKLVVKGGIEVADTNTHDGIKFPNAETNTVPDEETWLMWDNSEGFMFYFNGSWRTIEDNYNPSDERLKQNITGLGSTTDVLSLYERISPVKFQWNETMNELDPVDMEEEHVGLIAQDIEDYFPQWISEGSAGYKVIDDKGEIQYYNMQAIKELDSRTSFIESTYNASDALLVVNDNGNVGIGTASPSYKLDVNGSFRATSKSFDIPYPPDPENKRLVHGCIEGPELAVYYRGEAKLSNGEALIELPEYFETLTRKGARTVQLTAKGTQPFLLSYSDIVNGEFNVYGTIPDGEFSWEVKAVRADIEPLKAVVEREEG